MASPVYIATRGMPISLQDLVNHDCVSFGHPSGLTTWQLTGPDGVKEEVQVASRFSSNTAQTLRRATVAGLGITLLPSINTRLDLQAGKAGSRATSIQTCGPRFACVVPEPTSSTVGSVGIYCIDGGEDQCGVHQQRRHIGLTDNATLQ